MWSSARQAPCRKQRGFPEEEPRCQQGEEKTLKAMAIKKAAVTEWFTSHWQKPEVPRAGWMRAAGGGHPRAKFPPPSLRLKKY